MGVFRTMLHRWSGIFLIPLAGLSLAYTAASQSAFVYATHIGIITIKRGTGACLTIENPRLESKTRIAAVWTPIEADDKPVIVPSRIVRRLDESCDPANAGPKDTFYQVTFETKTLPANSIFFGVVFPPERLALTGTGVQADLEGNGTIEQFRICTSNEGLHFTVWSGLPLRGPRRWHRYHYLGYDVEPTCTEQDYKDT